MVILVPDDPELELEPDPQAPSMPTDRSVANTIAPARFTAGLFLKILIVAAFLPSTAEPHCPRPVLALG